MKLNNFQKAVLTIGVLAEVFLVVDWVGNNRWLVVGHGFDGDFVYKDEIFWTYTTVVTVVTGVLALLWKSKK